MDSQSLEELPKMTLNLADNSVFLNLVTDGSTGKSFLESRDSHINLRAAYNTSRKRWRDIAKPYNIDGRISTYKKWLNFIEFAARIILLQVPSTVNAFKMFETLNDRGLKTSQADLVENYIFGQSGENINKAQNDWSYIKGSLETVEEDDITVNFLRQSLICKFGYLREAEVYEKVQNAVKGQNSATKFLEELESLGRDYASLFNFGAEKWSQYPIEARRSLEVLNLLDIKPFRPLQLAIAQRFSEKEAARAFSNLVSLGVRLLIASSTRSGAVEQPLAKTASQVYVSEITSSKELFDSLVSIIPSDQRFIAAFETATVSNAKFARYYLRTLELANEKQSQPWFIPNEDAASITLEHILPLKPKKNWPNFTEDEIRIYSKRLGNLALIQATSNSTAKSDKFADKVSIFALSPYKLTKMISKETAWGTKEISRRQEELAQIAVIAWPYPE